jgi:ribosomal protein S18 acetylase RimI-like enzyme
MNPTELVLSELSIADYEDVIALWQRAGLPVRADGRDAAAAFAGQLAAPSEAAFAQRRQRVIGLRAGHDLVGVAVLTHDGRKGWINRLAVDPARRRQGLASRLIEEAERWFHEDVGVEIWAALIAEDNVASLAFFESAGYNRSDYIVYVSKRTRPDA